MTRRRRPLFPALRWVALAVAALLMLTALELRKMLDGCVVTCDGGAYGETRVDEDKLLGELTPYLVIEEEEYHAGNRLGARAGTHGAGA